MSNQALADLCQQIGRRVPFWVQGAGGNVSCKVKAGHAQQMWIKASGLRLDQMQANQGLVLIDVERLKEGLKSINPTDSESEEKYAAALMASSLSGSSQLRPSMETGLHVSLPQIWVIHIHALAGLLMAHVVRAQKVEFGKWMKAHWAHSYAVIPALSPGLELTRYLKDFEASALILIENHGIILQSDDPAILDEWHQLEIRFCDEWNWKDLMNMLRGPQGAVSHISHHSRPTLLKLYFPDSAVFLPRLQKVIEVQEVQDGATRYVLKKDAWSTDRDMSELWMATEILFHQCPSLSELPAHLVGSVAHLPTEKYRQNLKDESLSHD